GMLRIGRTGLEIDWTPAEETAVAVEAKYTNREGKEEVHRISNMLNTYVFPDFPENGEFQYRTLFMPDTVALDTFSTDFITVSVDDELLGGRQMSFTAEARYGTPPDQLSIWISTDFDGVYELENVEEATWVSVTDTYPLPSKPDEVIPWGSLDLWELMDDDDENIYVAFKYVYNPDDELENSGINWRIQDFKIQTNSSADVLNQEEAQFQVVHKGPLEDGRITINPNLLLLRSNSSDKVSPTTFWAISSAIN